jgi:hypothetical protein
MALILLLSCGCELVDRAARRPGEMKRAAVIAPDREESILRTFFAEDFAQRKVAHLTVSKLADFDSVSQPRPRIDDVVSKFGEADAVTETELSRFGVSARARVYEFGRLGLATPVARTDGEVFWTLIAADSE